MTVGLIIVILYIKVSSEFASINTLISLKFIKLIKYENVRFKENKEKYKKIEEIFLEYALFYWFVVMAAYSSSSPIT